MKLNIRNVAGALCLLLAPPVFAGSVIITNQNCTVLEWFQTKQFVRVHLSGVECDDFWTEVPTGQSRTVQVMSYRNNAWGPDQWNSNYCAYGVNAEGVFKMGADVYGNEDTNVSCSKDWAGVCQCNKD